MKRTVEVSVSVARSPRVSQASSLFDIPIEQKSHRAWSVDLPIEGRDWSVGLIVGASGAGKSTIAKALFGDRVVEDFAWPHDKALVDGFPAKMGIKEVTGLLTSVGLGSVPAWVRPYRTLSTGERFRATMARALAETDGLVVIDEFTSVVDRQVAKVTSHALQKTVRRQKRQLVAVTCHYDVIDWLQPDWIYQPAEESFSWRDVGHRPPFRVEVYAVDRSAWPLFRPHHYLSGELSNSAMCFCAFTEEGEPVGFTSYLHFPHPRTNRIKMAHRHVVLPDYQGLGIGMQLAEWMGQHLYRGGKMYHFVTSHPGLARAMNRSPRWKLLTPPGGMGSRRQNLQSMNGSAAGGGLRLMSTWGFGYSAPA